MKQDRMKNLKRENSVLDNGKKIRKKWTQAATIGLCTCMAVVAPCQSMAGMLDDAAIIGESAEREFMVRTGSDAFTATASDSVALFAMRSLGTGDLWNNWVGDLSFLSGEKGNGTVERPYQISTKAQLMGLSELAAKGMVIEESEGTYPGDYTGAYFVLTKNIDLEGMRWMPIGFYCNEADMLMGEVRPFNGHFDGNGKTVSNFKIYNEEWRDVGLFGVLEEAEITNLTVKPGYVVTAGESVRILAGKAEKSVIRDVTVVGTVHSEGTAGGLVGGILDGTIMENCTADHVAVDTGTEKEAYAGGIAGKAAESLIADCVVNTGDSITARIQGGGYVGGVVGFQNGTDIFNVHVMGTIGGSGSQSIGGVTGKYASGKMKVARFEGTIANSGMGSLSREGTFIGTHDTGFHFRYGTENGSDLAYLFADSEGKIAAGVCGSGIPDDNSFGYDAHIGFWHGKDNFFTLVQGQNTKSETERYFYEELENGVLHLIDSEEYAKDMDYTPDHFAPNAVGRPTRGYLVSVLQIDTVANVEDYYDVAVLTARGESVYCKELNKSTRGAVAAGDVVTVVTAPKNTDTEKYQMDGVPTYTDLDGDRVNMAYQTGGTYTFVMPAHDTEISAVYRKVAADIRVAPEELTFRVIQERSGDRRNPSIVTEVKDGTGKLIARYINGNLEAGTKVQEVTVEAIVDKNNDVADSRVSWSVDDSELLLLKKNEDEDAEGYTEKSASVELNLQADFFTDIIKKAEQVQRENGYRYAIPDTVYGNGTQGGLAVLTAKTRPAESFEGKAVMANCRIPVTFQIKDKTTVGVESVRFDKDELEFTVTRKLTGNRKTPKEEFVVSASQSLSAIFAPEYFDKKTVVWENSDPYVIELDSNAYGTGESGTDYKVASVTALQDAKWIRDLILADDTAYAENWKVKRAGSGQKEVEITVVATDVTGNIESASCKVRVKFVTEDLTVLYSSGGSGGSSGGSSGSSGSSVVGSAQLNGTGTSVGTEGWSGTWTQDTDGRWMYERDGHTYAGEWAYIYNPYATEEQESISWFYFDIDGKMHTGWYRGADGQWYFLHSTADGSQGHMYTGWHEIDGKWYFFGQDGRMYHNAVTPDGYSVDENGAWVVNGVVQTTGK